MSRKIVVSPTFCESHMIKYQIDNIMNVIDPDYLIYNECLFPSGPENKNNINPDFIKKYCKPGTKRGFDTDELEKIIEDAKKKYPHKHIFLNNFEFEDDSLDASLAYLTCVTNLGKANIQFEPGDVIFPYEPDIFLHEKDKVKLYEEMGRLKENEAVRTKWLDFVGSQNYVEYASNFLKGNIRGRKLFIKYGNYEFFSKVCLQYTSQNYGMCRFCDIPTYHYSWLKPGIYRTMRYEQLKRNAEYWSTWEKAIQIINENKTKEDIRIRNKFNDKRDYVCYIEIDHPKEMYDHPCFIK